ncbi:MAG: LamG-like jellyroll fold domain-containing protein, partial [Planctomycetota bacterium]
WQGQSIADGELLPTGPLHLLSGKIHLELFSGVRMVLAGQSQFSVDSPMQVTIDSGIARAEVPEPARGFRIKTGSGDIVDLGTEFSVAVDDSGADVHVIEGEVELHADSGGDSARQPVTIAAGTSRRLAAKTGVTSSELVQPTTIGPEEFQRRRDGRKQERLSRWLAADHILRQTPGLIGHYHLGFDSSGGKQIENLVRRSSDAASDGRIVAANASTDRWGRGDAALDFGRVGSRVRIQVPGEHRGLTLMAWVKIHSLDRWYNSLFLTDGHEDGEPHWQWMNDGRIFFSIKVPGRTPSRDGIQPVYYTPPIWTPSLSGRWVMLAVTYDIENRLVTHYLDGQAIDRDEIKQEDIVDAIRIGSASVGNWSQPLYRGDAEFVLRNLNGSMDQFSIASRPLTEDEILSFFEAGNPNE